MTRLPIVDFKTMEKVLLNLDFRNTRSKGAHFFTGMLMAEQPHCPTIQVGICRVLCYGKFFGKSS